MPTCGSVGSLKKFSVSYMGAQKVVPNNFFSCFRFRANIVTGEENEEGNERDGTEIIVQEYWHRPYPSRKK